MCTHIYRAPLFLILRNYHVISATAAAYVHFTYFRSLYATLFSLGGTESIVEMCVSLLLRVLACTPLSLSFSLRFPRVQHFNRPYAVAKYECKFAITNLRSCCTRRRAAPRRTFLRLILKSTSTLRSFNLEIWEVRRLTLAYYRRYTDNLFCLYFTLLKNFYPSFWRSVRVSFSRTE